MTDVWDVVVVGAGLAGSLAAYRAARAGRRVLLVERATFPRAKVCGCCLNPVGLGVLERAGLGDLPARLGAVPLARMRLAAGGPTAVLPLDGVAISRSALDAALVAAGCAVGVTFLQGTTARLGPVETETRPVELSTPEGSTQALARLVVAADGLGGQLLQRAGLDDARPRADARIGAAVILTDGSAYEPGTVHMACGRAGYLGLVRLEDGRLDLACALAPDALTRGHSIGAAACELLAEVGWPIPEGLAEAAWKGTPRLTRQAATLGAERLFVVGDAAGYVEPFTGQGMAWALLGAEALSPLLLEKWRPEALARWTRVYNQQVRSAQGLCGWLAWALRRPWLIRAATRALKIWPGLAAPLLHRLQHPRKGSA